MAASASVNVAECRQLLAAAKVKAEALRLSPMPAVLYLSLADGFEALLSEYESLLAERHKLAERIALAGGYHARSKVEVELADRVAVHEWVPAAMVVELLKIADCGRSRLHTAEDQLEGLKAAVALSLASFGKSVAPYLPAHGAGSEAL